MPYISTERVKEIREELKKTFPTFKFSVTKDNSTVRVKILSAPFNMLTKEGATHETVNYFWIKDHYKDHPQISEALQAIYAIMNAGNRTISEDADYGSIPAFYVNLEIGDYDKPFQVVESSHIDKPAPVEVAADEIQIIEYSEKSIAVIGNTYPIRAKLKDVGGKWNKFLTCGPGWIFSKTKLRELQTLLSGETEEAQPIPEEQPEPAQIALFEHEEVKQYSNIEDITEAANSGQIISLCNLANLVNTRAHV